MKILIPTDGSSFSRGALEQAVRVTRPDQTEVLVLVVSTLVDFSTYGPLNYAPSATWEVPTEEEASEILAEATEFLTQRGFHPRTLRRVGAAADTILKVAEEERVDLIVMGSHGRTGLTRFLLGSVSSQVLAHAPCSVLVAKAPRQPEAGAPDHVPVSIAEKI